MARPELGTKRTCPETGRKFYDLGKDPVVSPYTGIEYPLSDFEIAPAATRTAAKAPKVSEETEAKKTGSEEEELEDEDTATVALEDVDAEEEDTGRVAPSLDDDDDDSGDDDIDADVPTLEDDDDDDSTDDDDTFLEDDEEDDDVSTLVDGDIKGDDED